MNLVHIRSALEDQPGVRADSLADISAAARPVVLASLAARHAGPVLITFARTDQAEEAVALIGAYLPADRQPIFWDTPHAIPFEQLPYEHAAAAQRIRILVDLVDGGAPIIIAAARGLMHPTIDPDDLAAMRRRFRQGDRIRRDELMSWATAQGYQHVPLVFEPGSVAQRGGVIDLFPPNADRPIRLDLFGDEIESIRSFDTRSQRSLNSLEAVELLPPVDIAMFRARQAAEQLGALRTNTLRPEVAAEWRHLIERIDLGSLPAGTDLLLPAFAPAMTSLLAYLGSSSLVIRYDPAATIAAISETSLHAEELRQGFETNGELPPGLRAPYLDLAHLSDELADLETIEIPRAMDVEDESGRGAFRAPPQFGGRMTRLTSDLMVLLADGWAVQIVTDQQRRLTEILEDADIFPRKIRRNSPDEALGGGLLDIRPADVAAGWSLPDAKLLLLTDLEIFGFAKRIRSQSRRTSAEQAAFAESLTPGEYVVHIDQGVGRFVGLVRSEVGGVEREYLLLEYARGERLYVPVDQSDRVTRYSSGGLEPHLTRLGTGEWQRTKSRVRKAVREMAFELIQLYAAREHGGGIAYPENSTWDGDLAEAFPYVETPDQMSAIDDVTADLQRDRPMDRLVCGDVGFGKTEVALRAAFKVVNAGKQVAVLVPTTVLALQHFQTFSERLSAYPVNVQMLSRLKSKSDQSAIVAGLADGTVDIVIGTHRLVQNDIKFSDLGLVVIDEEQRFGVRHKEFLKRLRTEVDVLTMSATPIPRTLHMSLSGIRDISIINTAPQERLPIRTFVTESNDALIREVILREIDRRGQVYFVHNRVHSIDSLAAKLQELIPEASIGIGHGQMDESVLEDVILGFVHHDFDILLCTTIIESGIDIANVNTIVIDDADRFGLTQLYQLRGRVGRGSHRAYAYLLHKPQKALSEIAQARLDAIQDATELGAGMQVALRDMEIRGAGNVLGAEQSGNIAEVGYELYVRLLAQAVEEIKQGYPIAETAALTLDLPLTALIPGSYIADVELRLTTYRRIAAATTMADVVSLHEELIDRFGPVPDEVEHLLALIRLRIRCAALGIDSIVEREREIVLRPVITKSLPSERFRAKLGDSIRFTPNSVRLRLTDLDLDWESALEFVIGEIERVQ